MDVNCWLKKKPHTAVNIFDSSSPVCRGQMCSGSLLLLHPVPLRLQLIDACFFWRSWVGGGRWKRKINPWKKNYEESCFACKQTKEEKKKGNVHILKRTGRVFLTYKFIMSVWISIRIAILDFKKKRRSSIKMFLRQIILDFLSFFCLCVYYLVRKCFVFSFFQHPNNNNNKKKLLCLFNGSKYIVPKRFWCDGRLIEAGNMRSRCSAWRACGAVTVCP